MKSISCRNSEDGGGDRLRNSTGNHVMESEKTGTGAKIQKRVLEETSEDDFQVIIDLI